jgi:hypothetical protein
MRPGIFIAAPGREGHRATTLLAPVERELKTVVASSKEETWKEAAPKVASSKGGASKEATSKDAASKEGLRGDWTTRAATINPPGA